MRLLIDGNIILDVLQNRKPHVDDSAGVWKLCETEQAEGYVSALTFTNLVYIMRKELTPGKINEVLGSLGLIFRFADLTVSDMNRAAELEWEDYEDALQAVTARRLRADCIITRNIKGFKQSAVPALTPAEFISRL